MRLATGAKGRKSYPVESFRAETEYINPGVSGIVTATSAFEHCMPGEPRWKHLQEDH